jgi:dephospho-CoA kinase
MLKVALTGGIASGKSSVCKLLAAKGIAIIDADQIARELTGSKTPLGVAIIEHFGAGICTASGDIDRALLRQLVFSDHAALSWLNNLVHPAVRSEINSLLGNASAAEVVVVCIPLLFENNLQSEYDLCIAVVCDEDVQLERACARDNMSQQLALKMLASQISNAKRGQLADYLIDNNGTNTHLEQNVDLVFKQLVRRIGNNSQ